jgi:hypothetical protein
MVDIRIRVEDTARVPELMWRLSKIFGRSTVSFDAATKEVRIDAEWESRRVVSVIDAIREWIAESDVASAEVSIGDRFSTVGPTMPPVIVR